MAVTGKPRSGKGGRISLNGVVIKHGISSTITPHVADCDVTNFEGGGYEEHIGDVVGADVELAFNWDAHQNLYDSVGGAGSFITNALLYVNLSDNTFWTF